MWPTVDAQQNKLDKNFQLILSSIQFTLLKIRNKGFESYILTKYN